MAIAITGDNNGTATSDANFSATEFVAGWHLLDTIGEGRFGEVKLLMNKDTHELVATKVLMVTSEEMDRAIRKEICIHRNLQHPNIIGFYGSRREENIEFCFLEYATGGELFDRIEPDIGMHIYTAHRYYTQMICGLEYLHSRGIVHRDIKPENLLLDGADQLKIADFGFSTLFRHQGKERLLDQRCGTLPYMAPEVMANVQHRAEPIDIWSSGIVLLAMLTGQLPWDQAIEELCPAYQRYATGRATLYNAQPWCKLNTTTLSLIKSILSPLPTKRYTIAQIRAHRWFKFAPKPPPSAMNVDENMMEIGSETNSPNIKRKNSYKSKRQCVESFHSQPNTIKSNNSTSGDLFNNNNNTSSTSSSNRSSISNDYDGGDCRNVFNCFSQPVNIDNMFLSTQTQLDLGAVTNSDSSQGSSGNTQPGTKLYLRVVRRMTRFLTAINFHDTCDAISDALNELRYTYSKQSVCAFTITINHTTRRIPLVFKITINELTVDQILVDFRLAKGDGIEFKRIFLKIKNHLSPIVQAYGPNVLLNIM